MTNKIASIGYCPGDTHTNTSHCSESDEDTNATTPPLLPRTRVWSENSLDSTNFTPQLFARNKGWSESDEDTNTTTPPLFPRSRACSESSIDTAYSTPLSLPRARLSSDVSCHRDGYSTPKPQSIRKKLVQSSPRGVIDFEYSTPAHSITSSENSDDYSQVTPLPSLQGNLMTCFQLQDPNEYYQVLDILGEGSMGSVCRVKKRIEAVGGSARRSFVQSKNKAKAWNFLQSCFLFCPFSTMNSQFHSQDLFQATHHREENPPSQPEYDSPFKNESSKSCSKMISHSVRDIVYALKTINLDRVSSSDFTKELENEVEILKELDHPNIVRAIETFNDHSQLFIILELCDGGDLYSRDPYTEQDAAKITKAVFSAIAYMHSRNIIHRDIKFENIMFTSNDKSADVKLIDFGLSKKYASGSCLHDTVGTVYTMAPELLRGGYTSSVDVWSMGVVTYMLLSSCMPFFGKDRDTIVKKVLRGKFRFSNHRWKFISSNARKFISLLLKQEPKKRPNADQALKHSWLNRDFDHQKNTSMIVMDNVQASIQTFAEYVTLKKLALMIVAYKSTSQQIGFLRHIFDEFDKLKDGVIRLPVFKSTMKDYFYSDEELERIFRGMDIDGDGTVHYCEFLAATIETHTSIGEQRLAEAFDRLDCDNSGYITVGDLKEFLGKNVPASFLEETINAVDLNKDRKVSYDEYLAMWDHRVDEKRISNQLNVQQRRIQRMDLKQSLNSMTSDCGMTSDSGMSSSGGFSDDEIAGRFEFMRQKMAGEAGNAREKHRNPSLTRQARSNVPPIYPSNSSTKRNTQRKRHRTRKVERVSSKSGTKSSQPGAPAPKHQLRQQIPKRVEFNKQHLPAIDMNYPLHSMYPLANYPSQGQGYQWYFVPGQSQQQYNHMNFQHLEQ